MLYILCQNCLVLEYCGNKLTESEGQGSKGWETKCHILYPNIRPCHLCMLSMCMLAQMVRGADAIT